MLNNNQLIAVQLVAQGKTGKFISGHLILPEILNIFKDLPSHWTSLNKESQRSFNNLIFPKGISFSLEEKITTPLISSPFNVYSRDIKEESNLVELRGFEPLTSTLPV